MRILIYINTHTDRHTQTHTHIHCYVVKILVVVELSVHPNVEILCVPTIDIFSNYVDSDRNFFAFAGDFGVAAQLTRTMSKRNTVNFVLYDCKIS